jgi:hypothetical protein
MVSRLSVIELREGLVALARRVSSGDADIDPELRDKLNGAVDDLRQHGWPPERVIIAVKQVAADAGLRASRSMLMIADQATPTDAAIQQVVRCCIEQYYGDRLPS